MSTESPPDLMEKPQETSTQARSRPSEKPPGASSWRPSLLDACLIALFLGLTFLLGAFPLKDTDFYWHLRTGDWIREHSQVPRADLFTFTREGVPWIDLHWMFQVAISWVYRARWNRRAQSGQMRRHVRRDALACSRPAAVIGRSGR